MFRLRTLKNGLFQIHKKNGRAWEGTPRSILMEAVRMGIPEKELIIAVNNLEKLDHDYADFDYMGRFISTKRN